MTAGESIMATSIVTSKGQITIPIEVRNALGIKTGDKVEFHRDRETGTYALRRKTGSINELRGMFKYAGPAATIEEMNQAIVDHLGEEDERIKREWRERT